MVPTFPRVAPIARMSAIEFTLGRRVSTNRSYGGSMQSVERGDPIWVGHYTTILLHMHDIARYQSWFDSLRGGVRSALLGHFAQPVPRYYATTGLPALKADGVTAFNGTGTLATFSQSSSTLQIDGLPASFRFKEGDLVGIQNGAGWRQIFRVVEDRNAGSLGTVTSLYVEPTPKTGQFVAGDVVTIDTPLIEMVVDPDSIRAPQDALYGTVSFSAYQRVY